MNTMVTRDAERVTAEEIRRQALELEQSLGGVYSRLAVSLQLPIATRLIREIDVGLGDAKPVITTGLDALSRGGDLERLRAFFADLVALADVPEEVARRINYDAIISELGANHGVEYKKFLKDDDTVRQDTKEQVDTMVEVEGRVEAAKSQGKSAGK